MPTPPSKQPISKESSSSQSTKDGEYKRKIAALEKNQGIRSEESRAC